MAFSHRYHFQTYKTKQTKIKTHCGVTHGCRDSDPVLLSALRVMTRCTVYPSVQSETRTIAGKK